MKYRLFLVAALIFAASFPDFSIAQAVKVKPAKSPAAKKADPVKSDTPATESKTTINKAPVLLPAVKTGISFWSSASSALPFPELPYEYGALEPVIDKLTVEIHYDRHHRAYYNNFMKAIADTKMASMPITEIFANIAEFPVAVRNNGGGFYNHVLYWENMSPKGGGEPTGELAEMIKKYFGSFSAFTEKFNEAAKSRFGSGWAWLSYDPLNGELFVSSTANQDNPLMQVAERKGIPLLALDVWEHAYYLKYQNKRADYVTEFWKMVNWPEVDKRLKAAVGR
ncbi:MAG: superoxide dismutase [Bacteroidales bacterium]|jgi:Fe-Mn family superoxide dismutase|nr:superoxide dismutase [Bacteroidales bacterium]